MSTACQLTEACQLHVGGVSTACRRRVNCMPAACQLHAGGVSTACRRRVNCMPAACQLHAGGVSTVCRLYVGCLSAVCRLHVGCMSAACRLHGMSATCLRILWSDGALCRLVRRPLGRRFPLPVRFVLGEGKGSASLTSTHL